MRGRPPHYELTKEFGSYVMLENIKDSDSHPDTEGTQRVIFSASTFAEVTAFVKAAERYSEGIRRAYERFEG